MPPSFNDKNEIVSTFRGAGAMSADRARDPEELGVNHHLAFERLVQRAVLRDAGDGKFYLDELSWNAPRRMRLRLAFGVIFFTIAVLIALFASGALVSRN